MIPASIRGQSSPRRPRQAVSAASPSRVVPKPVPRSQVQDARKYQIEQLRRRFSPKVSTSEDGDTSLLFDLAPSDPDFPFELNHLECDLLVPSQYPQHPPRLRVKNKDIPRGFAINIEKGWDKLVQERRGATLLSLANALDRKLEELLSEKKSETVKLTIFKDTRHLDTVQPPSVIPQPVHAKPHVSPSRYVPEESFTREQVSEAKARRAQETRQLEARMGRMPLYSKSSDGVVYSLPLEPRRRTELPRGLQPVKSVQLIIPLLYPLQPLRILLNDVESEDAEGVEELFTKKAVEQRQMTLMSHLNFLAQNIHSLARQAQASRAEKASVESQPVTGNAEVEAEEAERRESIRGDEKSHIKVIERPPEWYAGDESGSSSASEDEDHSDYEGYEEHEDDQGATAGEPGSAQPTVAGQTAERGTALTFPGIELRGIELLQISILSLGVRCERCKMINEVTGLVGGVEKAGSCKKCTSGFVVKFRPELMHQNSARGGFIDAAGCTMTELLPSIFIPTCANCSTPSAGLLSVRGETTTNVCRECHGRFTFKLPEVKFLAYAQGLPLRQAPGPSGRRDRGQARPRAGEPLPNTGVCAHYRRSHRWFRFSCCGRLHPCDRCHDGAEDHEHEWASRMVCGWCGREQGYRPESCAFCGRGVVGRRGKGFWEGGKGTRDRRLMRRGDPRKYKRVGGGAVAKGKEKERE